MRVKAPHNKDLNTRLAAYSLEISKYERLLQNLGPWLQMAEKILNLSKFLLA